MNRSKKNSSAVSGAAVLSFILSCAIMAPTVSISSCAGKKSTGSNFKNGKTFNADKNIVPDYSGVYKISDTGICNMIITITKKNGEYIYTINGSGVDSAGILSDENDGDQIYLNFNGTLRSPDNTAVSGVYSDRTIMIQNYGNSMNGYICFEKCDAKYLEFIKEE